MTITARAKKQTQPHRVGMVTIRSSGATIDRWLKAHPGYVTVKATSSANASKWAVNEMATRIVDILNEDPDDFYTRRGLWNLISDAGPNREKLTRANYSKLLVLTALVP